MRNHLSVLMLFARSSIYKVLAVFAAMIAAEGILGYFALRNTLAAQTLLKNGGMEQFVEETQIGLVFAAAFVLISVFLCRTGCAFGSKTDYTLGRLSITPRWVFIWQFVYNTMIYLLLWGLQIVLSVGICAAYEATALEGYVNHQSIFLCFYRNDFLHSLLPLAAWAGWMRNIVLVLTLGACAAAYPVRQRKGKLGFSILFMAVITLLFFVHDFEAVENSVIMSLTAATVLGSILYQRLFAQEVQDEEDV